MIVKKLLLIISILLFSMVSIVSAVPFTTAGFMKVPDAYVLPANMAELSFSGYTYNERGDSDKAPGNEILPDEWNFASAFNLNFGIMDRAEVGIVYNIMPKIDWTRKYTTATDTITSQLDKIENNIFYVNAKLNLMKESERYPAISIGVENLFSESNIDSMYTDKYDSDDDWFVDHDMDDYRENSFYITATKAAVLRGLPNIDFLEVYWTLGIGLNGRFIGPSDDKSALRGVFVSLDSKLSDNLRLVLEEDGYCINAGLQYDIGNASMKLGIYRIDELVTWNHNPRVSFSMQYTFDQLSNRTASEKRPKVSEVEREAPGKTVIVKEKTKTETGEVRAENPLEKELEKIREKRKKAEKDLEELRKLLEE
ncbi:MAG: hypothetical protein DRH57_01775 [Candidatus Cloacimonadota bacterium]|nr:MAG: hypothetical protein DRH57_01775 [Candidatus Cloacimonadota bacterium]